jgi:ribosomal protein S18 acetylase RimI-like enzyme
MEVRMAITIRNMRVEDMVDVKGVDLMAWNDLMARCYGVRTSLQRRTDENILSYLHSDPGGAFVATDEALGVVGASFSHVWGATGWVGPISVLPSYQARGMGKDLLKSCLRYLEDQGCVDIGLETMPENATNLGMYLKVGLRPEALVLIFAKVLEIDELQEEPVGDVTIQRHSESSMQMRLESEIRRISGAVRPGLDYSKQARLTEDFSLGDTIVASSKGKVLGFSTVHTRPRREGMRGGAVRALAVDPATDEDVLEPLLASSELLAADAGCNELTVPSPAQCRLAVDALFSRGYAVSHSFERLMWMGSSGIGERVFNLCTWSG